MDLNLSKPAEVVKLLCARLRTERIVRQMTQSEVAARAGISANTVSNLEGGRSVAFDSVVRIAMVLGQAKALETLFAARPESLDDMLRYDDLANRVRVRRPAKNA